MTGIESFVDQAVADPSIQPHRPPEPDPLDQFTLDSYSSDGSLTTSILLTDDGCEDAMPEARITCKPGDVESLARWR